MSLLRTSRPLLASFRASRILRAGGGDDAKPRWTLPDVDYHKHTFQPSIPDKHFYVGHWNYAPITMWLRTRRPIMERVGGQVWATTKGTVGAVWNPIQSSVDANLPGFGFKALGVLGLLLGYNIGVWYVHERTDAWNFLEKLRLYSVGQQLAQDGFFRSDAEDHEIRQQDYDHHAERLNALWEKALADSTQARSFEVLCDALAVDESHNPVHDLPKPISWRFNMMPYGSDNADTQTFGFPDQDKPAASNYFFLDMGSVGDYADRKDNKPNPIRKGRHMYCAAYLPPTK